MENRILRLRLELADRNGNSIRGRRDISLAGANKGIIREILVPADLNLYTLHTIIQSLFGFKDKHLHRFSLRKDDFNRLTGGNLKFYAVLCGTLFKAYNNERFECCLHDMALELKAGGEFYEYLVVELGSIGETIENTDRFSIEDSFYLNRLKAFRRYERGDGDVRGASDNAAAGTMRITEADAGKTIVSNAGGRAVSGTGMGATSSARKTFASDNGRTIALNAGRHTVPNDGRTMASKATNRRSSDTKNSYGWLENLNRPRSGNICEKTEFFGRYNALLERIKVGDFLCVDNSLTDNCGDGFEQWKEREETEIEKCVDGLIDLRNREPEKFDEMAASVYRYEKYKEEYEEILLDRGKSRKYTNDITCLKDEYRKKMLKESLRASGIIQKFVPRLFPAFGGIDYKYDCGDEWRISITCTDIYTADVRTAAQYGRLSGDVVSDYANDSLGTVALGRYADAVPGNGPSVDYANDSLLETVALGGYTDVVSGNDLSVDYANCSISETVTSAGCVDATSGNAPSAGCADILSENPASYRYANESLSAVDTSNEYAEGVGVREANAYYNIHGHWVDALGSRIGQKLRETLNYIYDTHSSMCVFKDGLNLIDDIGGVDGYFSFLKSINEKEKPRSGMHSASSYRLNRRNMIS